jgi:cell division protein FtsB
VIRATTFPRDLPAWPAIPRRRSRRYWWHLVLFAACALLVNGLFGERGLLESVRARRAYAEAGEDLARLRQENQALRERARQLRSDPRAIEAVARGELGLAGRDEVVITLRDLPRGAR